MRMSGTNITGIHGVLSDPRILRTTKQNQDWYLASGIVQVLTETEHPADTWSELKRREPALALLAEPTEFYAADEAQSLIVADGLTLDGVLRLVQSISSPRAERLKRWLADSARLRMDEMEDPELATLRARRLFAGRGYSRRWIDKRLRGISARQELVSEWYRRGARQSEDYRQLTNELMSSAFGKDVESYRRFKGLAQRRENLRDQMSDLELSLTSLAETVAATVHRDRNSQGFDQLLTDVQDAGSIVATTIRQIERSISRPVVTPGQLPVAAAIRAIDTDERSLSFQR